MKCIRKVFNKCTLTDICFGLFLLLAIVYMSTICYFDTISGDEYFSVGFANNTKGFLFLLRGYIVDRFGSNGWIEGELLHDYLSVQPGEQFSILAIHRNVRGDVHPPLYFMLLNVLSSFFVDQVTIFPGFFINVVCGIIICTMLYLLGKKIFNNSWMALISPMFWIGSEGARTTITYLRMYAPLCALCLICIYLHLLFLEEEKTDKWLYVSLGLCTMIGTLTHYYFYLMLVVIGLVSTVRLLQKKNFKKFGAYAVSHAGGWAIAYMAYPYVFKHLLSSNRGAQAQENLLNNDWNHYRSFFVDFLKTINEFVYNNKLFIIVFVFVILCVLSMGLTLTKKKSNPLEENTGIFNECKACINFGLIGLFAFGYLVILFKISYSSKWLYMSPVFALLTFLTVGALAWLLEKVDSKRYAYILLGIYLLSMLGSMFVRVQDASEAYEYREQRHEAITAYSDSCDVLFFYTEWNNLFNNQIQELMEFDQIYSIDVSELETTDYDSILSGRKQNRDIVIYIPIETEEYDKRATVVAEKIGKGSAHLIIKDKFAIYHIEVE